MIKACVAAAARRGSHPNDPRDIPMPIKIPHLAWILVGDGRKAIVLRNEGDALYPNLQVAQVFDAPDNPRTHLQGTDRPGRVGSGTHRSAVENPDWHDLAEHRFARDVARVLTRARDAGDLNALIIVAPPRILSELRLALPPSVRSVTIAELDKDLTHFPTYEIERYLAAA
jgi:protein required for attachment to host cells